MTKYVYLIQNGDLYNIGSTDDLELVKKSLHPGVILASLSTNNSNIIVNMLHNEYSSKRLPQSNYFRLTKNQSEEIRQKLLEGEEKSKLKPFFSGYKLVIIFLLSWVGISTLIIKFAVEPLFKWFN